MWIRRAEIPGRGLFDVRLADGRVAELAPAGGARAGAGLDAAGGALLPGLHDHHLHLLALAAALTSVACVPPAVRDARGLARVLADAQPGADGWIRGVGYHESVAGELDRETLTRLAPARPVRIQHRSGALWMLNEHGVRALGLDAHAPEARPRNADAGVLRDARGRATGRLLRADAFLRARLAATAASPARATKPDLTLVGRTLARCGVTGVTDATPHNGAEEVAWIARAQARGALPQRVAWMGGAALPPATRGEPERAWKIILDEAAHPTPDALRAHIARAHAARRSVAIHCVTRATLVLACAALSEAGVRAGDRIEHASVAPPELCAWLARLGVCVVTQPNFVYERGDQYLADVEARDRPFLYCGAAFDAAGVPLGGGTDAPYGSADPWLAMRAAVARRTRAGQTLGAREALSPERALALFTTRAEAPGGAPREVAPGARADLCLLALPWRAAREALSAKHVRATWCAGRKVWDAHDAHEAA